MNTCNHHRSPIDFSDLPDTLPENSTILVAKPAPFFKNALAAQLVERYTQSTANRIVLVTSVGAEKAIEQHLDLTPELPDGRLGIIEIADQDESSAPFQEYPVLSLSDLVDPTRVVLACWELETTLLRTAETTHVAVQSLAPLLAEHDLERTCATIEQLIDHRVASGHTFLEFEYTEYDDTTLSALQEVVDGIVWVEESNEGLTATYRRVRS